MYRELYKYGKTYLENNYLLYIITVEIYFV